MSNNNRKKGRGGRKEKPEFEQKLLDLARVTRVVKGGRRFRFRATVVAGNRKGKVGVGVAKGSDVSQAIQKAFADARKNMITVNLAGNTISHQILKKQGAARVFLNPAPEGRGIIAGGAVRTVVDLLGVKDIVSKSMGTANKLNVARATVAALADLAEPRESDKAKTTDEAEVGKKENKRVSPKNTVAKKVTTTPKSTEAPNTEAKKVSTKKIEGDDLTKIEGIGPKIAEALNIGGLKTFTDVSNATPKFISQMIEGIRGNHEPTTWPKQASLAAEGKWEELKELQDKLDGGRE